MQSEALRCDLVMANHILARENVLDVFGHVSVRDPEREEEFLLARSISPEMVTEADLLRFTLNSEPVDPSAPPSYSERFIHGEIYIARRDVGAVCHFHAPAIMPFCITKTPLVPVSHVGATMGNSVPVWCGRDEFGDTDLVVKTREEGASLARTLGLHWALLMKNHGGVVAGRTLLEAVFRAVYLCRDAEIQIAALQLGPLDSLNERQIELAGAFNLREPVLQRAWSYWARRASGSENA